MSWVKEEQNAGGSGKLKPSWKYREGVECVTVLPNETRDFMLISGENDPTKTWESPMSLWIHQFKGANGFQTLACNKWEEACLCCYENEIYKLSNPNYKASGGKLPMGLSKKALIQVWDFQQQKVLWLLAGKHIVDGMDFILTRNADTFKGFISITRTGEGFNTSYRVDIAQPQPVDMKVIKEQVASSDQVAMLFNLSHQEIMEKTGKHPVNYFQTVVPRYPQIDISGWGSVPQGHNPMTNYQSTPNPAIADPQVSMPNPAIQGNTQQGTPVQVAEISENAKSSLLVKCTQGIYVGQKFDDVIKQVGKPYMQYLLRAGTEEEKKASQFILDEWDAVNSYIRGEAF